MPPPEKLVGVVGKTNVGKSTLFSAMTLVPVKIANHPFTTIEPNVGVGYVRRQCAHVKLGLPRCNPRSGFCVRGDRFIPVKIMDVAGLIPGASQGRGLGNKFMDDLRQADVLIHVVDASGSTDLEGNPVRPGTADPVEEAELIQREIDEWFVAVVTRVWEGQVARKLPTAQNPVDLAARALSGISITKAQLVRAIEGAGLASKSPRDWNKDDLRALAIELRRISKPILIAANKVDVPEAADNLKRLRDVYGDLVVPVSALAELILRHAARQGLIDYLPGDPSFSVVDEHKLAREQRAALELIERRVLKPFGSTGVQQLLNRAVFEVLGLITVYPVEDANKFTDHSGNVLPDAFLVPKGTTARELAYMVHTDLGEGFLYAINAATKERVGEGYVLNDGDVIKVVSARRR
ncbi:MAG: redox-regulated ATPase YchF [Desulfurococcaceae archaeon]